MCVRIAEKVFKVGVKRQGRRNVRESRHTARRVCRPILVTALHALRATRFSHEKAVRPSVRPSVYLSVCLVKHVDCDKTKESFVQIFVPSERSFVLVFCKEAWLVGATLST